MGEGSFARNGHYVCLFVGPSTTTLGGERKTLFRSTNTQYAMNGDQFIVVYDHVPCVDWNEYDVPSAVSHALRDHAQGTHSIAEYTYSRNGIDYCKITIFLTIKGDLPLAPTANLTVNGRKYRPSAFMLPAEWWFDGEDFVHYENGE